MAAKAVKVGYRWLSGNGKRVKFWEDTWFGTAPLALQFWELYCFYNEKIKSIAEVWVEGELRLSFRRSFFENIWKNLCDVAGSLVLNNDFDALVLEYEKSGIYSSQSLYAVISLRGVTQVHTPAIWSIMVPPKIQLFLWLLSHNKLATVDNLNKRGYQKPC
jgi:hypothetical protein